MSCQSLAPSRAFPSQPDSIVTRHRSVRFSSESQASFIRTSNDTECQRDTPGSISLTTLVTSLSPNPHTSYSSMSQSAPSGSATFGDIDQVTMTSQCRFPKLEECAHFHYERVSLGGLRVEIAPDNGEASCDAAELAEGWMRLKIRSHVSKPSTEAAAADWFLTRNADNFRMLDNMLHRCIYDRKVSGLLDLSRELRQSVVEDREAYERLIEDYLHHLSIIADDTINCGPILNWLQIDNKGHRLLVANEDSSSINTPAVAAAYSVRKYVSQARDEISFDVGDMISIIDMPGPQESLWWRGKRGFTVGFFPHTCVAVIGDKVPRHMTQPPPIVGSVAVAPIKPVLRKHGKLISLFRSFILSRPSRRTLKQQGILRERVFGCDLGEHLLESCHSVPLVLIECARVIEAHGAVDGIYRLSGGSGLTQRLRAAFDEGRAPDLTAPPVLQDIHAVASLLKMYFRELPNPLCTYQLYEMFVSAVQPGPDEATRLQRMRDTIVKLPPPHYRTLEYLMLHLRRVSLLGATTGMTARNMAIVWAPNLLRSPRRQHALHGVAVQAVVTELLICCAEQLFMEQPEPQPEVELRPREEDFVRRPKSLPINPVTKLISLEEAQQRGGMTTNSEEPPALPPPSGAIAAAAASGTRLPPLTHKPPQYIEVGSGPNNLPQYHTVIELRPNGSLKRGLKRSPSGWRGLFSLRNKQQRSVITAAAAAVTPDVLDSHVNRSPPEVASDEPTPSPLRPVKSCESLHSDAEKPQALTAPEKQHARSASCDSYFEPWQVELADMRLRLSPQERDGNMFSEEDDTTLNVAEAGHAHSTLMSENSSPGPSEMCSVEPSPRKPSSLATDTAAADVDAWERKRSKLEDQLGSIGYIDGGQSPQKRHSDEWPGSEATSDAVKRLCKDRESPHSSTPDVFHSLPQQTVKMRERSSPRKNRASSRYSGLHQPLNLHTDSDTKIITIVNQIGQKNRLTWHGTKDTHSTLIKIDWPLDTNNLTPSTLMSSPLTPVTPVYDALESDSESSESKDRTKICCKSCDRNKKCLKCELNDANRYENVDVSVARVDSDSLFCVFDDDDGKTEQVTDRNIKESNKFYLNMDEIENKQSEKREYNKSRDSLGSSPVKSTNISYQNLNRLSNMSTNSSNSDHAKDVNNYENASVAEKSAVKSSVMTSSHESSSGYSNVSPKENDDLYECFNFNRPNYISLQSSSSSKSNSPLKSPLRSTISITFKSPTKPPNDYEIVEVSKKSEYDSVYEDVDLEKNLSIVEEATVPQHDASLPTQNASQPETFTDLLILESPAKQDKDTPIDVYSQVKFFKKSIEEVNAMISDSPTKSHGKEAHYENIDFSNDKELNYENVYDYSGSEPVKPELCIDRKVLDDSQVDKIKETCKIVESDVPKPKLSLPIEQDDCNNAKGKHFNVRQLANKFESPTENKGIFNFDRPYSEVKYSTLERKEQQFDRTRSFCESKSKKELSLKVPPPVSPKTFKLSKYSVNARSLDENAFVTEFGRSSGDRRNCDTKKFIPDLNLNTEEVDSENEVTPTAENKISFVQHHFTLPKSPTKSLNFEMDKKLSRERIEKYKEERRNFLREKYSSQSFRSPNPSESRSKKRHDENEKPLEEKNERLKIDELPKFERRNTVDLGQRMRFTVNRPLNVDGSVKCEDRSKVLEDSRERSPESSGRPVERKEKISPSYNIKDMAAMFEQKSQSNAG